MSPMTTTKRKPRQEILGHYLQQVTELSRDGVLPSPTWLKNNGHVNLYHYMLAHPARFRHITVGKQTKRGFDENIRNKRIAQVRRLIAETQYGIDASKELIVLFPNGVFPTMTWLKDNGLTGLVCYMSKYSQFFEIIPGINRKHKSDEDHVEEAERLSRQYGGRLPGGGTVVKESGWALYKFMRRKPGLFIHIPGALPPEPQDIGNER